MLVVVLIVLKRWVESGSCLPTNRIAKNSYLRIENSYMILIKSVLYYQMFNEGWSAFAVSPVRGGGNFFLWL
jgi:hypothetical protein